MSPSSEDFSATADTKSHTNLDGDRMEQEQTMSGPHFTGGPSCIIVTNKLTKDYSAVLIDKRLFRMLTQLVVHKHTVAHSEKILRAAQDDSEIAAYGNDQCKKLCELDDRAAEIAQTREDIECGIPKLVQARQRVERLEQEISVPRFTLECLRDEAQQPLEAALEEAKLLVIPPGLLGIVGSESINSVYIKISSTGPATRSEGILIPEGGTESKETFPKQAALDNMHETFTDVSDARQELNEPKQD